MTEIQQRSPCLCYDRRRPFCGKDTLIQLPILALLFKMREGVEIVDTGLSATSSAPTYRRDKNDLEADFANEIDAAMAGMDHGDDAKARNAAPPFTHVDSRRDTAFADDVSSLQLTVDDEPVGRGEQNGGGDLSAIQEVDEYQYLRRRNWLIVIMLCIFLALTIAIGVGVGLAVKGSPNEAGGREEVPSSTLASPPGESSSGAPDTVSPDNPSSTPDNPSSSQSLSGEGAGAISPSVASDEPTSPLGGGSSSGAPDTVPPDNLSSTSDSVVPAAAPAKAGPTGSAPTGSASTISAPTPMKPAAVGAMPPGVTAVAWAKPVGGAGRPSVAAATDASTVEPSSGDLAERPTDLVSIGALTLLVPSPDS